MHARIEKKATLKDIFRPEECFTLIKEYKQNGKSYKVVHLQNEDILDLHFLVDRQEWD